MSPPLREKLPDLSEHFCSELGCFVDLPMTDEQLASLKRAGVSWKTKSFSYGLKYKGQDAWNHVTLQIERRGSEKVNLVLFVHTFSGSGSQKEPRQGKLAEFLETLEGLVGEVTVHVSAVFRFPAARFSPVIVFPDRVGLQVPLPDFRISITGLRLHIEGGPVESLFVDTSSPETIYVGVSWTTKSKFGLSLIRQCLGVASTMARRVVTDVRRAKTSQGAAPDA